MSSITGGNDDTMVGYTFIILGVPLVCVSTAVVIARLWWRLYTASNIGFADVCVVLALFMAIAQETLGSIGRYIAVVICYTLTRIAILDHGFGHHASYLSIAQIRSCMMFFYVYQTPYKILVTLTKMSFLFLYLDIFPDPKFRMITKAVNAWTIAGGIAFTLTTIFQCTPITYNWNKTLPHGHCINPPAFWYAHAAWNTFTDVVVLVLPIPLVYQLQMARNQKLALIGVFVLGGFVCGASIVRMVALNIARDQANLTYATGRAFLWTQIESCASIICCCLPTLKAPVARFLPKVLGHSSLSGLSSRGKQQGSIPLSDVNGKCEARAWKDSMNNSLNDDDDTYTIHDEERVIVGGIKKTVSVRVITQESKEDKMKASLFDRQV